MVLSKRETIGIERRLVATLTEACETTKTEIPGQTLRARVQMAYVPARPSDKPTETTLTCDQGDYKSTRAFIEDLGVALTLESRSSQTHYVNEFTALDMVR